jgi:hypothetical protein
MSVETYGSVSDLARRCASFFQDLCSSLEKPTILDPEISLQTVHDELGRFRVWAGNIGALQNAKSRHSLDYRLRDAPQIQKQVVRILVRLRDSLRRGK